MSARPALTGRPARRRGRHAAPRRTLSRSVLLPGAAVLLAGGASVAVWGPVPVGAAGSPAVGASLVQPRATGRALAPVPRLDPSEDLELVKQAEQVDRASRTRRLEATPPAPTPPPAPAPPAFVRPVEGPVTSPFGRRWGRLHAGLDMGVPVGTPVRAVADGVVTAMPFDARGYGNHLQLLLADGTVVVLGHLSEELVTAGPVAAGQVIALSGDTGHSTGPHLHFELRSPEGPFDPRPWLEARGIVV